jgi:hypothetical protein
MLLSRFWYIIVAVAAAASAGAALLGQGVLNRQSTEHVADELARDRTDLDTMLRLEARSRLDRISFITVDPKLGGILHQAAAISDPKQLTHLNSETKDALRAHIARLLEAKSPDMQESEIKPDLVFAVDMTGRIIGQLGSLEGNPAGSSLITYPFVERALHGYLRDDVIVYDRRVYRVAARPVLFGGEYVGAIAHGYKFDNEFAQRVSQGLGGASVLFFYGRAPLASYVATGAPAVAELAAGLPDALTDARFKRGERTDPRPLQSGGRSVYSLLIGSAARSEVGYAVARPLLLIASAADFFQGASREDVQALPLPLLGGGALLLALIGLSFIYFERDRPYAHLRRKLQQLAAGERDRLIITEWRGSYRKLADGINQALDKTIERAGEVLRSTKKKANLDEILGPTPESNVEPYFGFADAQPKAAKPDAAARPAPRVAPAPLQPLAAGMPNAPLPLPPVPVAMQTAANKPLPLVAPRPANATVQHPGTPLNGNGVDPNDELRHFREVYAQYMNVRRDCGESTDGLSYEKFESTLTKTRDQVLSKTPGRNVRFTVYVKEGKAALKAAPLKR